MTSVACDARVRPFPSAVEVECEQEGAHTTHEGTLKGYAHPGSVTTITWEEDDRRTFHGEWPGPCPSSAWCSLPFGHRGRCA